MPGYGRGPGRPARGGPGSPCSNSFEEGVGRGPSARHPLFAERAAAGSARPDVSAVAALSVLGALVMLAAGPAGTAGGIPAMDVQEEPEVRELLERAESRYETVETLRASFEQTITNPLLERTSRGHGTWYQKGPGLFRLDFEDPEEDLIVADGTHLWLYYPSTHPDQVIRSALEANPTGAEMLDVQGRIFRDARTRFDAEYAGRETIGSCPVHQIVLTPRGESHYRMIRVWIDARSHLVRQFEITEANETERLITLHDLEPNVPIPDELFQFEPPAGVDVFAG